MATLSLNGRKILLGVSGSIAAYKSVYLARLLTRQGAEVRVLMTPTATGFISPITFSSLTRFPVPHEIMAEGQWNNHVDMGLWADLYLVAPATANTLSGMASGRCDNLLLASYLSARCPVMVAPAMDLDMWDHTATRRNLRILEGDGVAIVPVGHGELASGLSGPGRMAEPEDIVRHLERHFQRGAGMEGRRILVTAGPTREALDPVRFLSNHSTGKMGVAIAEELASRGAEVHLVLGPGSVRPSDPRIAVFDVETALEMLSAAEEVFSFCDVAIFTAAVADYRPAEPAVHKIPKGDMPAQLKLERNPDIAATLGERRRPGQVLVGFALETDDGVDRAREKMVRKHLDLVVLNTLADEGAGFGTDTNKVTFIGRDNKTQVFGLKPKAEVAADLADELARLLNPQH